MISVRAKSLVWSQERQPNESIRYNHVVADSALGCFSIEWKGWKKYDSFDLNLNREHISSHPDALQSAKDAAAAYIQSVIDGLIKPMYQNQAAAAALRSLAVMGFTYEAGATAWKPPMGPWPGPSSKGAEEVRTDSTGTAIVDPLYHWRPIDADTPRGRTLQLIHRPSGIAATGVLHGCEQWHTHWAPAPTFPKP